MSRRKIEFMSLLEDYFETYLPYSRGLSRNTIESYKQSFMLLLRFMQNVKGIDADDIRFSSLDYDTLLEFAMQTGYQEPAFISTFSIFGVCAE